MHTTVATLCQHAREFQEFSRLTGRLSRLALRGLCALGGLGLLAGCSADFTAADTAYFQPPITTTSAPARPLRES